MWQKRWFFGVALRTCISLVPRGSLHERIPDTSLKGVRRRDSAVEEGIPLWNKCGEVVVATGEKRYTKCTTVALVHNPRGWLGEIQPEEWYGICRVGDRGPSCLAYLILASFCLPYRYHRLPQKGVKGTGNIGILIRSSLPIGRSKDWLGGNSNLMHCGGWLFNGLKWVKSAIR